MIKFRKGGLPPSANNVSGSGAGGGSSGAAAGLQQVTLDWWETPEKYRRRPIDETECEIINVRNNFY